MTSTLTAPGVTLTIQASKRRTKKFFELGHLLGNKKMVAFDNDIQTAYCALLERVYYHLEGGEYRTPFKPQFRTVVTLLAEFTRKFSRIVTPSHPIAIGKFPEVYIGRRKVMYEKAAEKVQLRGFLPSDAILSTFVKYEKLELVEGKKIVPRLVQPRKPEYNVCVGRYIRHLEHEIFGMVASVYGWGRPVILKGFNAYQRAQHMRSAWESIKSPVAIGLDATRFDQHVSYAVLKWEHARYLSFFHGEERAELKKFLKAQLINRGFIRCPDGKIKYEVKGGRCSGDMNTSLGNCLIMCAAMYSFMSSQKLTCAFVNDGDDGVLIVNKRDAKRVVAELPTFFKQLGFLMKMDQPVDEFEKIVFCQSQPVFDGISWRMVRCFPSSMSKDATILRDITNPVVYPRYLKALGDCGLSLTAGMPVLQEYYLALCNASKGLPPDDAFYETGMAKLAHGLRPCVKEITPEARFSFWKAFGLLPDAQEDMERRFHLVSLDKLIVTIERAAYPPVPGSS